MRIAGGGRFSRSTRIVFFLFHFMHHLECSCKRADLLHYVARPLHRCHNTVLIGGIPHPFL